jgi:AraC family transcriptional regulator, regulatory protein of adaptative response / methylated-DNA-[protein]-cysteine methyltransferase
MQPMKPQNLILSTDSDAAVRRWAAVQQRDTAQDGHFVYAVRTTGVYCRPSCPSRPARRDNVSFFDSNALARQAGYRACLRCKPDDATADSARRRLVLEACATLEHSESGVKLDALAQSAGMNPHHFHRVFKSVIGLTPKAYFQAVRARRVQTGLRGAVSVTEALYNAGFNSSSRFYEDTRTALGMPPKQYLGGAPGQEIRYAVESCVLGMVLVAATNLGVCGIEFGDSAHELVQRLRDRFPKASFVTGEHGFQEWVGRVLRYVEHPSGLLDLPLDVRGTVFQRQVWDVLAAIPSGKTATYGDVARAIGQPKAMRAVAQACASNQLALAIPCHRVIRSDGQLSGYRWGAQRKAELLEREGLEAQASGEAER